MYIILKEFSYYIFFKVLSLEGNVMSLDINLTNEGDLCGLVMVNLNC